jgi:hypothetical protein
VITGSPGFPPSRRAPIPAGRIALLAFALAAAALIMAGVGCGPTEMRAATPGSNGSGSGAAPGSTGAGGSSGNSVPGQGGAGPSQPGAGGSAAGPGPTDAGSGTAIDSPGGGNSAGGTGGGDPGPVGPPVALPLVVTDHFQNRGWFGDASIAMYFKPGATLIKESVSVSGPCAKRPPGAQGKCLQFTYTPPPGFAPPAKGAFVGLYMLPTLRAAHPEAMPATKIGDPNWGLEPGVPVAPGARRVAFQAASDQPLRISFRAGTDKDNITLPEATDVLTSEWSSHSISLAGGDTGATLLGGFAWTIKDTGKPATFYVDGIVWDGEGVLPPKAPMGAADKKRDVVVINNCKQPVWVAIGSQMAVPEGGGFKLDAGQMRTVTFPGGFWSGRLWGRTGCTFDGAGVGKCETGDCGGRLGCGPVGGKTPATLAEITWSAGEPNPDFYDLSLVDGYNLPMAMAPLPGSHGRNPGASYDCLTPSCVTDLNATCPNELRVTGAGGQVVGCLSACEKFSTDEFCCRNAHNQPETCPPFSFSKTFKAACPTAYSYAYDDATSTFTCKGEDYAVWFCP